MSVTSALYTGVSGLLQNGEAMNVIGNNISNVNTVGYKGARTLFSDMLSQNVGNNSQIGKGVQMQAVQNVFSQGSTQTSENVTDLAIQGNSFFALKPSTAAAPVAAQSSAFLSRAGAFHTDSNLYLVNPDGYQVLDTAGNPIKFLNSGAAPATDFGKVLSIDNTGLITYLATDGITQNYYSTSGVAGVATTPAAAAAAQKVAVVTAPDPTALKKVGGSLYQATTTSGVSAAGFSLAANKANGVSEQILSNTLEQSTVDLANEFVKMITTQRAYSANSKTITTSDQMTQEVLSLIR
ncbi:flagellar hook protein FlgE [Citrifermentans bemidjiense Bem]|uniref:Flagellar hook protein FlgE n=1 Tax=Citrifermentans bemidjiense (strain ATCC BAA-1014 / DSM 16622 / JCM 12645 / Bem) TaxID=404380 RepID=B5EEN5_CITBB|nr:flagellar hook basal-body protein [Citrifermentans bemidjiense]ACH40821.1 flagellar hook protein FlgE [Citrifermentans bemidjiense Bem]